MIWMSVKKILTAVCSGWFCFMRDFSMSEVLHPPGRKSGSGYFAPQDNLSKVFPSNLSWAISHSPRGWWLGLPLQLLDLFLPVPCSVFLLIIHVLKVLSTKSGDDPGLKQNNMFCLFAVVVDLFLFISLFWHSTWTGLQLFGAFNNDIWQHTCSGVWRTTQSEAKSLCTHVHLHTSARKRSTEGKVLISERMQGWVHLEARGELDDLNTLGQGPGAT